MCDPPLSDVQSLTHVAREGGKIASERRFDIKMSREPVTFEMSHRRLLAPPRGMHGPFFTSEISRDSRAVRAIRCGRRDVLGVGVGGARARARAQPAESVQGALAQPMRRVRVQRVVRFCRRTLPHAAADAAHAHSALKRVAAARARVVAHSCEVGHMLRRRKRRNTTRGWKGLSSKSLNHAPLSSETLKRTSRHRALSLTLSLLVGTPSSPDSC